MVPRLVSAGMGVLAGIIITAGPLAAQTLDKIKQRGVLVVGSKADYKPFGFRDPAGDIVGFEPDLGRDVADKTRREARARAGGLVEPHAVPAAGQDRPDDRHHERHAGTAADRRHRRAAATTHRASTCWRTRRRRSRNGSSSRTRRSAPSRAPGTTSRWRKNTAPRSSHSRARPKRRPRSSRAIASAGSTTTPPLPSALRIRNGRASRCLLETILVEPWGLAVKLDEREGPWGQFMAKTIADWHRSGKLIELEKKWNIPPSAFLKKMHEEAK